MILWYSCVLWQITVLLGLGRGSLIFVAWVEMFRIRELYRAARNARIGRGELKRDAVQFVQRGSLWSWPVVNYDEIEGDAYNLHQSVDGGVNSYAFGNKEDEHQDCHYSVHHS